MPHVGGLGPLGGAHGRTMPTPAPMGRSTGCDRGPPSTSTSRRPAPAALCFCMVRDSTACRRATMMRPRRSPEIHMKRSTERILTTHTGSLPRTPKVVELLLAEQAKPGTRRAELHAAVRDAIAHVAGKQIECGLDVINDGEEGRTDYTVHVLARLAGFAGESTPPLGTGDPEFPELAQLLAQFASPFQHRPSCNGDVAWKDFAAAQADIDLSRDVM